MSRYMSLIGQNARKALLDKINSKTKNKILKRYAFLLGQENTLYLKLTKKTFDLLLAKA